MAQIIPSASSLWFCSGRYNMPKSAKLTLPGIPPKTRFVVHSSGIQTSPSDVKTTKSTGYKPTIWSYDYVQSLKGDPLDQALEDKAQKLEKAVRSIIANEKAEFLSTLELIDDVQRLGLGYKFDPEISRALNRCVSWARSNNEILEKSLYATALYIRLLRQHGYEVSQDILKSFLDHRFEASFTEDVKGMLALYEASYLAFEGEHLLDEARAFTSMHLRNLKDGISKSLVEEARHALEMPLHHRMPRLEARRYIEAYGKSSTANKVLLEYAKLDFNTVQSALQMDIKDVSGWWKVTSLANKLSFARDRLMECFFMAVGIAFEPRHHKVRKVFTKAMSFITVIDDVYDVYGSLDELELFTDAIERWDVKVQNLPDYMKICFLALYNTINNVAYDTLKKHDEYILPYLAKAWGDICKAFLQEKKWSQNKETPTFEDYIENGFISVSGIVLLVHTYFLMSQNITKQGLESLENCHNLLRRSSIIYRLCNDLATSTAELERGETANSITCIMRDTGLSEEGARQKIRDLIQETWKKMNKDAISGDSPFEKQFVEAAMNLARIAQCIYQHGDGHGAPDTSSKNRVLAVIIDPIQ